MSELRFSLPLALTDTPVLPQDKHGDLESKRLYQLGAVPALLP